MASTSLSCRAPRRVKWYSRSLLPPVAGSSPLTIDFTVLAAARPVDGAATAALVSFPPLQVMLKRVPLCDVVHLVGDPPTVAPDAHRQCRRASSVARLSFIEGRASHTTRGAQSPESECSKGSFTAPFHAHAARTIDSWGCKHVLLYRHRCTSQPASRVAKGRKPTAAR